MIVCPDRMAFAQFTISRSGVLAGENDDKLPALHCTVFALIAAGGGARGPSMWLGNATADRRLDKLLPPPEHRTTCRRSPHEAVPRGARLVGPNS